MRILDSTEKQNFYISDNFNMPYNHKINIKKEIFGINFLINKFNKIIE
jgi:hypothetical protein